MNGTDSKKESVVVLMVVSAVGPSAAQTSHTGHSSSAERRCERFRVCTSGREVSLVICRGKSVVLELIAAEADARCI